MDGIQKCEIVFFEHQLHRSRKIHLAPADLTARLSRLSEYLNQLSRVHRTENRLAFVPSHRDALVMMREVIQIEPALIVLCSHKLSYLLCESGLPISRQPHHLVLVPVLREAKELSES